MIDVLRIWDHYGPKVQARKIVEEAYELSEAINERRMGETVDDSHIVEEVGDLEVMLAQVRRAYGISQEDLHVVEMNKINRQILRMREESM